jgi:hypothetical protein
VLGFFENFPEHIHRIEDFSTSLSSKRLQQRLVMVLQEINQRTFSFEEVTYPTVPECTIIFEVGLAEAKNFNYIDGEEAEKGSSILKKAPMQLMDFFFAIRYYKGIAIKKTPLRFDYYMIRFVFGNNSVEIRVFHERGPRYISPEDVITFLVNEVNKTSSRRILKRIAFQPD